MKIVEKRKVNNADVFNMVVDDTHTFVIQGGVVTHNCDCIRYFCMARPMKAIEPYVDDGFDQSPLHTIFKFKREDFR